MGLTNLLKIFLTWLTKQDPSIHCIKGHSKKVVQERLKIKGRPRHYRKMEKNMKVGVKFPISK